MANIVARAEERKDIVESVARRQCFNPGESVRQSFLYVMEHEAPLRVRKAPAKTTPVPDYVGKVIGDEIEKARTKLAMERMEREKAQAEEENQRKLAKQAAESAKLKAALEEANKRLLAPTPKTPSETPATGLLGTLSVAISEHFSRVGQSIVISALTSPEGKALLGSIIKDALQDMVDHLPKRQGEGETLEVPHAHHHDLIKVMAHQPRTRRPKVVIVGLLGDQSNTVKRELAQDYNLVFLPADTTSKRLRTNLKGVDKVYGMVKFIDHRIDGVLNGKEGGPPYVRVNGGVTDLVRLLKADGPTYRAISQPQEGARMSPA